MHMPFFSVLYCYVTVLFFSLNDMPTMVDKMTHVTEKDLYPTVIERTNGFRDWTLTRPESSAVMVIRM